MGEIDLTNYIGRWMIVSRGWKMLQNFLFIQSHSIETNSVLMEMVMKFVKLIRFACRACCEQETFKWTTQVFQKKTEPSKKFNLQTFWRLSLLKSKQVKVTDNKQLKSSKLICFLMEVLLKNLTKWFFCLVQICSLFYLFTLMASSYYKKIRKAEKIIIIYRRRTSAIPSRVFFNRSISAAEKLFV